MMIALLHELDRLPVPDHLEHPEGYDHRRAGLRATELADRLSEEFGGRCPLDRNEDASYYFAIGVPAELAEAGVHVGIRLSNYGDLAVVTTPSPDSHAGEDGAVAAGALSVADRRRIEAALSDLGYVQVPPRLLHRPFDGVTRLVDEDSVISHPPHQDVATRWTRFFEHL